MHGAIVAPWLYVYTLGLGPVVVQGSMARRSLLQTRAGRLWRDLDVELPLLTA